MMSEAYVRFSAAEWDTMIVCNDYPWLFLWYISWKILFVQKKAKNYAFKTQNDNEIKRQAKFKHLNVKKKIYKQNLQFLLLDQTSEMKSRDIFQKIQTHSYFYCQYH